MYPMRRTISWNRLTGAVFIIVKVRTRAGLLCLTGKVKEMYTGKYADTLLESGNAYYAFDTPEDTQILLRKQYESEGKLFQYDASTRAGLNNSLSHTPAEVATLIDSKIPYVIRFQDA